MDAEDLVALLDDADIDVSLDESKLNLPAVWVRPIALVQANLAGEWTEQVQLCLMVGQDVKRARKSLRGLFQKVLDAGVHPDGDVRYATVTRPSKGQPVPALVFPLNLLP